MPEKKRHYEHHEHTEESGHCLCHNHEQEGREICHCHAHDDAHGICHHDHDEESECGCGCGCGHDHDCESDQPRHKAMLRYTLGAVPVVLGFLSFLPLPVCIVASVLGYLLFGLEVWKDMLLAMRKKHIFTEFTLMCVASVGAFAIGEFADAAAVMYLYSLGERLSEGAYVKSKRNISELLEIVPETATVLREGRAVRVSPEEVAVGEVVLIVAGERIPLDGYVVEGGGNADTSSVTGEAKPLELYDGIFCPSGAILSDGSVYLKVSERYESSIVAKLTEAVREASGRKSTAEKKITRFARIFTPLAFGVAFLVCFVGTLMTGDFSAWLRAGLVILVVSCPCSLVLSVPLTYFAGIGSAAARGIVFRGGEMMDAIGRMRAVALDKTGTITESGLCFDGVELYGETKENEFLSLSYDVLMHSPHAAAISFCKSVAIERCHTVTDVENLSGRGIVCRVNGMKILFGNAALMREHGIAIEDSRTTAIFGAADGILLGKLNFSSHLKEGSADAVAELKQSGIARIVVLSGDGEDSVAEACREAGIDEFYAALTPSEKVEKFEEIESQQKKLYQGSTVAYCGDGLNDSAVIACADVGIAMGGCGAALTVRSADIVLMDDNPAKLCEALRIARRTSRIAGQNIVLSLGIKIAVVCVGVFLSAAAQTQIPMGLAIVADVGAAILAVLNALRAAKRGV